MMKNIYKIQRAIKFATKTHEVYQKQKRKGKDIAYITHPLTVGIILASIGADEDVVCGGILHDTIEDSTEERKVTFEMLNQRFGDRVARMVQDVTETDKSLSWEERKEMAKEHIKSFSHDSLLVKSADIISNGNELIDDYKKEGEQIFQRFNASKEKMLKNQLETITSVIDSWPENPLANDLKSISYELNSIGALQFMPKYPARQIEYKSFNDDDILECSVCNWTGKADGNKEYYDQLFDVSCPNCGKMILVVSYPLVGQG
jgi:hypothetical protein